LVLLLLLFLRLFDDDDGSCDAVAWSFDDEGFRGRSVASDGSAAGGGLG